MKSGRRLLGIRPMPAHRCSLLRSAGFMFLALCLLQLLPVCGWAQVEITGRLLGTVTDNSGAVIPNASATITNQNTGTSSSVKANSSGEYLAPYLQAGTYDVKVEAPGFAMSESQNNVLDVGRTLRVNIKLKVGSASEVVQVSAASPLIQTSTSDTSGVIGSRQLENIPLNGGIFSQAVNLLPGTQAAGWQNPSEAAAGAGAQTPIGSAVNGLPFEGTQYYLDGVSDQEPVNDFINITPPIGSIQELKIEMSNPGASTGAYGGALVNVNMKSGTNQFHGSAFEFFRDDTLNATPYFAVSKPPFRSNQFGGDLGGPIFRNKAFFFVDYQGTYLKNGGVFTTTVPTALMRQGIFSPSEGFNTIYDPKTGLPFPNNQVPLQRWDPVSVNVINVLKVFPLPNVNVGQNLNNIPFNYTANGSSNQPFNQFDVKGDYQFGDGSHLLVRESYVHGSRTAPTFGAKYLMGNGDVNAANHNHNADIGYDRAFTSKLFMQIRFGFQRFDTTQFGNDNGQNLNNQISIPNGNIPGHIETTGLADFSTGYLADTGSCHYCGSPEQRVFNDYQINGAFTWTVGNHNIQFGADIRRNESTVTGAANPGPGVFTFSGNYTSNGAFIPSGAPPQGGNQFADFLLGLPTEVVRGFVNVAPAVRFPWIGLYAQDDFRATQKLTLNLGVRYDRFQFPYERHNYQSNFNPMTGVMDTAQPGNRSPNVDTYNLGLAPRIGLAYAMNEGRTVLRGAFGLDYFNDNFGATDGTLEENYPLFPSFDNLSPTLYTPFWTLSGNGLQPYVSTPIPLPPHIALPAGASVYYVPKNFRTDAVAMWNFGIEQQLTHSMALDINYVGNHGYHLFRNLNINTPYTPGPGDIASRRPFFLNGLAPQVTSITERTGNGDSHYNSLQVQFNKRFTDGLWAIVSYTWAHDLDDRSVFWPYNDKLNYGEPASSFYVADYRHNFVGSYGYNLPIGHGRRFLANSSRIVDVLAGGWVVSGITQFRDGIPLVFTVSSSLLNTGTGNRANLVCQSVRVYGNINNWFDKKCFSAPAPYSFGNSGRGAARGPGVVNFDVGLNKQFALGGARHLDVRADAFDIFNHAEFGNPNTTLGDPQFGKISSLNPSVTNARQLQLSGRFIF